MQFILNQDWNSMHMFISFPCVREELYCYVYHSKTVLNHAQILAEYKKFKKKFQICITACINQIHTGMYTLIHKSFPDINLVYKRQCKVHIYILQIFSCSNVQNSIVINNSTHFTQVLNSTILLSCIKSLEYEIANSEVLS